MQCDCPSHVPLEPPDGVQQQASPAALLGPHSELNSHALPTGSFRRQIPPVQT
jgi:hypothetical protein